MLSLTILTVPFYTSLRHNGNDFMILSRTDIAHFQKKFFGLVLALLVFTAIAQGQSTKIDSLKTLLARATQDSNKVNLLYALIDEFEVSGNYPTALLYADQQLKLVTKLGRKRDEAYCHYNIAYILAKQGNYKKAFDHYFTSEALSIKINYQGNLALVYTEIASLFREQGNYAKALEYDFKALKVKKTLGEEETIALALGNIGITYKKLADYKKAMEYYLKSLEIYEKLKNQSQIARTLSNIANIYLETADYEKSLEYSFRALKIKRAVGNELGVAITLANIGNAYQRIGDYEKALKYTFDALPVFEKNEKKVNCAISLYEIGQIYTKQKNEQKAIEFYTTGLGKARETGALDVIKEIELALSIILEERNKFREALEHYKAYISARDSIFNEENTKSLVRSEMNFEFEKKEAQAKLEQEKKEAIALAESRKQRMILFIVSGMGLVILGFGIFAYRSFLRKKKINLEITSQKAIIEEKQKEILDSIHYAQRIQRSLLPSEKYIERMIKKVRV